MPFWGQNKPPKVRKIWPSEACFDPKKAFYGQTLNFLYGNVNFGNFSEKWNFFFRALIGVLYLVTGPVFWKSCYMPPPNWAKRPHFPSSVWSSSTKNASLMPGDFLGWVTCPSSTLCHKTRLIEIWENQENSWEPMGTHGNSRKLMRTHGNPRNSRELKRTQGNSRKHMRTQWTQGNSWELMGTQGNSWELMGTHGNPRNSRKLKGN